MLRWIAIGLAGMPLLPLAADPAIVPLTAEERTSAARVEAVTIPSPGEFFAAVSKTGRPDWAAVTRCPVNLSASARPQIAMNLGAMVADGYVAVENQDGQTVKNIGRDIMTLAKKLNVGESVIARGNSIADFAENNDWNALKEELEATQNEVKLTLIEQKDEDLVVLVSLGAWLRGLEVATNLTAKSYSEQTAALLRQPGVADYYVHAAGELPERVRDDPLMRSIRQRLAAIHSAVSQPVGHVFSAAQVESIGKIAAAAVREICEDPSPSPPAKQTRGDNPESAP